MSQDYGAQINKLREEIEQIKELLTSYAVGRQADTSPDVQEYKTVRPMRNMHPDPRLSTLMEGLCAVTEEQGRTGAVSYLGVFTSSGRQSNWIRHQISTDDLLALIENKSAATVLQSIGSADRLNLLLTLLKKPMSVAGLVECCGFSSTGQVYHHLRPLIAADIVEEADERGVYAVKFHRIQGIIMLLAGVSDLLDPQYSQGDWIPEREA